ncbi:MAG TPA: HNH endonuclease [Ktedonobacterales bacterium]|nr:HNH endonuclease [Ktedonobacterales bacterium]
MRACRYVQKVAYKMSADQSGVKQARPRQYRLNEQESLLVVWAYQVMVLHPRIDKEALCDIVAKTTGRSPDDVAVLVRYVAAYDPRRSREKPVLPLQNKHQILRKVFDQYWEKRAELQCIVERRYLRSPLWTTVEGLESSTDPLWIRFEEMLRLACEEEEAEYQRDLQRQEESYLWAIEKNFFEPAIRHLNRDQVHEIEGIPDDIKEKVLTFFLMHKSLLRDIEYEVWGKAGSGYRAWGIVVYYRLLDHQAAMAKQPYDAVVSYVRQILQNHTHCTCPELIEKNAQISSSALVEQAFDANKSISTPELLPHPLTSIEVLLQQLQEVQNRGTDRESLRTGRNGQDVLRDLLLIIYGGCCALCETREPTQLVASHILSWSSDEESRLDPHNAILLCRLHDGLFDKGLIGLTDALELIVSDCLDLRESPALASAVTNVSFRNPIRFTPSPIFLAWHREHYKLVMHAAVS